MNDRELLELAAKAAGYSVKWCKARERMEFWRDNGGAGVFQGEWSPLDDDGDALRLAVKLQLLVSIEEFQVLASDGLGLYERIESTYAKDPATATRSAIVRAAAEIGRVMQ